MQCFARVSLCLVLLFAQVFVRNGAAAMVVILLTCEAEMPSNRVGSSKQAARISEGRCTALAHGRFTAAAAMAGFDHRAGGQTLFPVQHLVVMVWYRHRLSKNLLYRRSVDMLKQTEIEMVMLTRVLPSSLYDA